MRNEGELGILRADKVQQGPWWVLLRGSRNTPSQKLPLNTKMTFSAIRAAAETLLSSSSDIPLVQAIRFGH